jgi:hypothetical protein
MDGSNHNLQQQQTKQEVRLEVVLPSSTYKNVVRKRHGVVAGCSKIKIAHLHASSYDMPHKTLPFEVRRTKLSLSMFSMGAKDLASHLGGIRFDRIEVSAGLLRSISHQNT